MQGGKDNAAGKGWSEKDSRDESRNRNAHHGADNAGGYGKKKLKWALPVTIH